MLILGIDTTAVSASAAVAEINGGQLSTYSVFSVKNKMTHSENLMPMIDQVIRQYGTDFQSIGLIAVNVGPGSFTGVRIGVATVKGLSFAKNLPCAPVSTLESIAWNLQNVAEPVCALMDARRNQFYYAFFQNGVRQTPDSVASLEDISSQMPASCWLCGDGAPLFNSLYHGPSSLMLAPAVCRDQNGLSVAICGERMYASGSTVSGKDLRPVYLRIPQAERERLAKEKGEE